MTADEILRRHGPPTAGDPERCRTCGMRLPCDVFVLVGEKPAPLSPPPLVFSDSDPLTVLAKSLSFVAHDLLGTPPSISHRDRERYMLSNAHKIAAVADELYRRAEAATRGATP